MSLPALCPGASREVLPAEEDLERTHVTNFGKSKQTGSTEPV